MASGLIYLAIAGMWVSYFLPRWIHDREEFSGKSVERYKSALKVVASKSPGGLPETGLMHTDLDFVAKNAQKMLRRRMIFTLLTFSLVATLVGGVMNKLQFVYTLVPISGIALYIVQVRRETISERLQLRRVKQLQRENNGISTTNLAEVITPKATTDHWIPLSERELTGVVILPKGTAEERRTWQPDSVPTPTYLSAPKAVASKRIIDLTEPGKWSDEQEKLAMAALNAVAPSKDEIFDQILADEAVDRLRDNKAVNE
jgi:uncharacterized membrane protein YuzA (DUF378 family)